MKLLMLAGTAAAVVAVHVVVSTASAGADVSACNPNGRLIGQTVVYCGSATAKLSTLGIGFKGGTCRVTRVNGVQQFSVKIGIRTPDQKANNGKPYFGLVVTGSLSRPTGGGVIAYAKGGRWIGVGVSFKGNARGGSFVASGINGSRGHAIGSYRC